MDCNNDTNRSSFDTVHSVVEPLRVATVEKGDWSQEAISAWVAVRATILKAHGWTEDEYFAAAFPGC